MPKQEKVISGFKIYHDNWWELHISPFRMHVWEGLSKDGYEVVIHYGDSTILKDGFPTEKEACAYALNYAIERTEDLLKQLRELELVDE